MNRAARDGEWILIIGKNCFLFFSFEAFVSADGSNDRECKSIKTANIANQDTKKLHIYMHYSITLKLTLGIQVES